MNKLGLFLFWCCAAVAQHQHPSTPAGEKPVALLPGLGIWKHPIATHNPEAQKFFDQGLVMVYGFNRPEALRSFRKVLELDPHAAMAKWGIAMALGPYMNMESDPDIHMKESCEATAAGLKMTGVSAMDRDWLEAAAARCPDFADPHKYVAAMRALAARYPDDPDAQTLFAESLMLLARWHWYSADGKPAEGIEEAEHVLELVMRRFPNHPGANHYYIHAVESSPTPERAVPSSQRLMGIVPAAGHIVHMPAHIWLVLGDYETAAGVNERAAQVDREYFEKTGVMSSYYAYYLHNLDFIVYARSMQGRVAETNKAIAEMEQAAAPMAQMMPEMAGVFDAVATFSKMRLCAWNELLAAAQPKADLPLVQGVWRYSRAVAFAMKGRLDEARTEQKKFQEQRAKMDRKGPWGNNSTGDVMDLAAAIVEARTQSSPAAAVPVWRHAVEIQDALIYDEPPAWYYPVRESLGAALLLSGDAAAAENVFREGARRGPNNGRMLFGLLESLKAQHKTDAAAWVERELEAAWKGADLKLRLQDL